MKGGAVSESAPIYYEEMSKVAGTENDKQSITLIANDDAYNFGDYITLRSRTGTSRRCSPTVVRSSPNVWRR